MQAAINTRPPRRGSTHSARRRTIDGGALAAGKRCDGCTATGRGGAMAGGAGGRSTARVLTVVVKLLLDLFWI